MARSRSTLILILILAGLVAAPAARGELVPVGNAFEVVPEIVNPPPIDPSPGGLQSRAQPAAVALPGGGFALVWIDDMEDSAGQINASAVKGRLIDAAGAVGAEFHATLSLEDPAARRVACPALANLGAGRFALSWAQDRPGGRDVWVERFSLAAGAVVSDAGGAQPHGTASAGTFGDLPKLAGNASGRSALSWAEVFRASAAAPAELSYRLLGLNPAGAPVTTALRLGNAAASDRQVRPAVLLDNAGIATAFWLEPDATGLSTLWGQRFRPSGAPLGQKIQIGQRAVDGVAVARQANGELVLVWAKRNTNGATRVMVERRRANLKAIGLPRSIGNVITLAQPELLANAAGDFALAWLDGDRLKALHVGADLKRRGAIVNIGYAQPELILPRAHGFAAALSNGKLFLAWEGEMPGSFCPANGIRGRIFELR